MSDYYPADFLGRIRPSDGRVYVQAGSRLRAGQIAHCDGGYSAVKGESPVADVCPVTGEIVYLCMRVESEAGVAKGRYFWAKIRGEW